MARPSPAWIPSKAGFGYDTGETGNDGDVRASREAAVKLKTVLQWTAVAFVLWWIIQQPVSAAHLVNNIGNFLSTAATGFSHFISTI
jgi:hypothetical protein